MARPTLSQLRGLPDKRTTYQWEIQFESLPSGVSASISPEDINLRAISTASPKKSVTYDEYTIRGYKLKQPGVFEVNSPIELTFISTIDMAIEEFFRAWREACVSSDDGSHKPVSDISCNIIFTLLDRENKPIWKYKLKGCMLADYDTGELNSESGIANTTASIEFIDVEDGRP